MPAKSLRQQKYFTRDDGRAHLYTPALVVDVVVGSVIASQMLKGIPGKCITAVIVNRLNGRAGEKPHPLPCCQARELEGDASPHSIKEETFEWVIVQRAKSVRNVESVMA